MLFCRILLILFSISAFEALAKAQFLSYSDYVHLTEREKRDFVIKVMEFMVEEEKNYQKDPKFGLNLRQQFLHEHFSHLKSFFIDSAHAEDSPIWIETVSSYIDLVKNRSKNSCIFAGWISTMRSNGYCAHPSTLSTTTEGSLYKKLSKSCTTPGKIACNPHVFGFKKLSDSSLFCVDAASGAHNSSYLCMRAALKEPSEGDEKDDRINFLKKMYEDKATYEGTLKFLVDVCLCKPHEMKINEKYSKYMVPHRTCYGLMGMAAKIQSCQEESGIQNISFYKNIDQLLKNIVTQNIPESRVDDLYRAELKKVSEEDKKKICETPTPSVVTQVEPKAELKVEPKVVEDDVKTPTLEVTGDQRSKEYKVTATLTNHDEWTFNWVIDEVNDPKIGVGVEEKENTTSGVAQDSTETSSPNTKEIIQQRFNEDYKFCGTLTKDKDPNSPIKKCVDIKKLESSAVDDKKKATTPYYPGPPQPQAPPPIRRSSDTSAQGIR